MTDFFDKVKKTIEQSLERDILLNQVWSSLIPMLTNRWMNVSIVRHRRIHAT